jgi:hypothetical protein
MSRTIHDFKSKSDGYVEDSKWIKAVARIGRYLASHDAKLRAVFAGLSLDERCSRPSNPKRVFFTFYREMWLEGESLKDVSPSKELQARVPSTQKDWLMTGFAIREKDAKLCYIRGQYIDSKSKKLCNYPSPEYFTNPNYVFTGVVVDSPLDALRSLFLWAFPTYAVIRCELDNNDSLPSSTSSSSRRGELVASELVLRHQLWILFRYLGISRLTLFPNEFYNPKDFIVIQNTIYFDRRCLGIGRDEEGKLHATCDMCIDCCRCKQQRESVVAPTITTTTTTTMIDTSEDGLSSLNTGTPRSLKFQEDLQKLDEKEKQKSQKRVLPDFNVEGCLCHKCGAEYGINDQNCNCKCPKEHCHDTVICRVCNTCEYHHKCQCKKADCKNTEICFWCGFCDDSNSGSHCVCGCQFEDEDGDGCDDRMDDCGCGMCGMHCVCGDHCSFKYKSGVTCGNTVDCNECDACEDHCTCKDKNTASTATTTSTAATVSTL